MSFVRAIFSSGKPAQRTNGKRRGSAFNFILTEIFIKNTLRAESPSIFLDKSSSSRFVQEDRMRLCSQGTYRIDRMNTLGTRGFFSRATNANTSLSFGGRITIRDMTDTGNRTRIKPRISYETPMCKFLHSITNHETTFSQVGKAFHPIRNQLSK